jgi:hypothetical protein
MEKLIKDVIRKHNNKKRKKLQPYLICLVLGITIFIFAWLGWKFRF